MSGDLIEDLPLLFVVWMLMSLGAYWVVEASVPEPPPPPPPGPMVPAGCIYADLNHCFDGAA